MTTELSFFHTYDRQPSPSSDKPDPAPKMPNCESPSLSESEKPRICKRQISMGVELEFIVPYVVGSAADPDQAIADELAPLLRVPRFEDRGRRDVRSWIHEKLSHVLRTAGLPTQIAKPPKWDHDAKLPTPDHTEPATVHGMMDETYCAFFSVISDLSLEEHQGLAGYDYVGVELVTPAVWNDRFHRSLIRLAVAELASAYRLRANPTCGFHCHVGFGLGRLIDPRTMRRYAALLWASLPLLGTLHAPEREILPYSQSCRARNYTQLGKSKGTGLAGKVWEAEMPRHQAVARQVSRDRWLGEPFDVDQDPFVRGLMSLEQSADHSQWLKETLDLEYSERFGKFGQPGRLDQDREFMCPKNNSPDAARRPQWQPPQAVYHPPMASDEIDETPAFGDLTTKPETMRPASERPRRRKPAIKRRLHHIQLPVSDPLLNPVVQDRLRFYQERMHRFQLDDPVEKSLPNIMEAVREVLAGSFSSLIPAVMLGDGKTTGLNFQGYTRGRYVQYSPLKDRATVEIRMGSASLDPDWVVAWASICARLLEFSRDASDADYMQVIRLLAWAQEERGEYDGLDLFVDIGAFWEMRVAEERLGRDMGNGQRGWAECPLNPEVLKRVCLPNPVGPYYDMYWTTTGQRQPRFDEYDEDGDSAPPSDGSDSKPEANPWWEIVDNEEEMQDPLADDEVDIIL